jgi:hypothetical protein
VIGDWEDHHWGGAKVMASGKIRHSAVAIVLWASAAAIGHAATWAVPGVANGSDSGSHWATELRVQNRDTQSFDVTLTFWADGADTASEQRTVTIAPGQTVVYKNALRELWQAEEQRGAVIVEAPGASTVTAFRYTDAGDSVLGQAIPVKASDEWLSGAAIGDLIWLAESTDYDSGVRVFLGSDDAQAEVVFLDAANAELARTTVQGPGRSRWLGLADLGIQNQPVVRAEVRFLSGRGTASGEVVQLSTGDRMGAGALQLDLLQTELAVHPVLRNSSFRTDARVYNPTKRTVTVYLIWNGKFTSFALAPAEVREVVDVAQAMQLDGDQQGLLRITCALKIEAMARMVRVNSDGTTGPGELMEPENAVEVGGLLSPWVLAGIPEQADGLFLSLRGGSTPSQSTVDIADSTGALLASLPDPLTLNTANSQRLDDLLQAVGLPALSAGATVSVTAQSGQVAPAVLGLLHGSGDVSRTAPSRTVATEVCVGPEILAFDAENRTLDAAGTVTLNWNTSQAASVTLSTDGQARDAVGSASWDLAQTSTVTLTASNACGEATRDLTVAVGLPVLTAAQVPAQADAGVGSPGQLARFTADNLSQPGRVSALLFQTPNGTAASAEIEGVDTLGRLYALVPYIWLDGPDRYFTGNVQVSAVWDDGRVGGSLPFHIAPLTLPDDPPGLFRGVLQSLEEMAKSVDAQLRDQGMSDLADAQNAGLTANGAALHKLVDDISASGSATAFYSTTTTGDGALSFTVTQQDLAELMAYELNLRDALARLAINPPAANTASAAGVGQKRVMDGGTCIGVKEPFIPFCKAINVRKQLETAAADRAAEFVKQFATDVPPDLATQGENAVRDWVKKRLAKLTLFGLTQKLQNYYAYLNLVCLVRPIELDSFYLITQPPRRTTSALKEVMYTIYNNQPTLVQVNALLKPHYDGNNIRDKLIAKEAKYIADQLAPKSLPKSVSEGALKAFLQWAQGDSELKAVEAAAKALNFKPSQSYQVGKCDLVNFYPAPPKKGSTASSAVRVAASYVQGEDNFYYLGSRMGARATMCIVPKETNFIFSDSVEARGKSGSSSGCQFSDQVVTARFVKDSAPVGGDGAFTLPDFSDDVQVGPSEGVLRAGAWTGAGGLLSGIDVQRPAGFAPQLSEVPDGTPWVQEYSFGDASAKAVIKKVGKNKWEIEGTATGALIVISDTEFNSYTSNLVLDTQLTIPVNRSGTYTLNLDATAETAQGDCALGLGLYSQPKSDGGSNGYAITTDSPKKLSYSVTASDDYGPAGVNIALFAYATTRNGTHPVECKAKATIELIVPEN